jgi:hypothetical protein
VPYWNWTVVQGNPWATTPSDLWYSGNSGFGGNGSPPGSCVRTGPFRQGVWELAPSAAPPLCLKRGFNDNPPDSADLTQLLNILPTEFVSFESSLRSSFSDYVHCLIGGTMCSKDSASAPEFVLVHGIIDKVNLTLRWLLIKKAGNNQKSYDLKYF